MVSTADELKKLADLKEAEVLTQDEFEEQKALILAQSRKSQAVGPDEDPPHREDPEPTPLAEPDPVPKPPSESASSEPQGVSQSPYRPERSGLVADDWRFAAFIICTHFGMVMYAVLSILLPEMLDMDWRRVGMFKDLVQSGAESRVPFHFTLLGAPTGLLLLIALPWVVNAIGKVVEPSFHADCGSAVLDYLAFSCLASFAVSAISRVVEGDWFSTGTGGFESIHTLLVLATWGVNIVLAFAAVRVVYRGVHRRIGKCCVVAGISLILFILIQLIGSALVSAAVILLLSMG